MNVFTVSFFGHREVEEPAEVETRLEKLLYDIVTQKEYVEFLIGRDGGFDMLASSVIRRTIKKYGYGNTSFVLVLPYMKAEFRDNEQKFLEYYDEVEICAESSTSHYKAAIQVRNKSMVDRSDLVVCCIQHKGGGAYQTVQYAKKQNHRIVNVALEEVAQ